MNSPTAQKCFYFISYNATGYSSGRGLMGIGVTSKSPAQWAIDCTRENSDGPYVIIYAEEITKAQHDEWREIL